MTRIAWSEAGQKFYEAGVDRGVLYTAAGGVPWNGLTSVEQRPGVAVTPYYLDGVKYMEDRQPGDFSAVLTAYTYPDEFLEYDGIVAVADGLFVADQPVTQRFGLSWRTGIGNDTDGAGHAYKIHVAYNLVAVPSDYSHETQSEETEPTDFSWDISGIAPPAVGYRPTAHYIIDTRLLNEYQISRVEELLYGSESVEPSLPDIQLLKEIVERETPPTITVVDNGDGTWTATSDVPGVIELLADDMFTITAETAIFLDEEEIVYQLSDD